MDQKKKIMIALAFALMLLTPTAMSGQGITKIQLADKHFDYMPGRDSISVFFNLLDGQGNHISDVSPTRLEKSLTLYENDQIIPAERCKIAIVGSGQRIPSDYTFSVLVDNSIPQDGKKKIFSVLSELVESAPDSCVFLSFFGNEVKSSRLITKDNYRNFEQYFSVSSDKKYLFSAVYAKLAEFEPYPAPKDGLVLKEYGYENNYLISRRAAERPDRNIVLVFTEGSRRPTTENIIFADIFEYRKDSNNPVTPFVYAFYYIADGNYGTIERLLDGLCAPKDLPDRQGRYMPADDMDKVLKDFETIVNEKSYDYEFRYKVPENKIYVGRTNYSIRGNGQILGQETFSVGSPEKPWPVRTESAGNSLLKYFIAILVTILVFAFFFFTMKVFIPWCRSRSFERKYYKVYVPEVNVRKRVCHFCGQEILPGQRIVIRCKHIMHVDCWKQNDYHCSEYGQNCKDGIQPHVHKKELFTKTSMRESLQTLSGVVAALVAWLVYDLVGRGGFKGVAEWITGFSLKAGAPEGLYHDCIEKTSALLMIGLLLGFFLSLVFRYNDEYKSKNAKILFKILGLSLLSGFVGMVAFGLGAVIMCWILSATGTTFIPWYCSVPAYILFSLSVAALLSWKSTIPLKSALLGGGIASLIGFIVLFFFSSASGWVNILLDFIIYGGGLGASLVTVRMLSERYFLIIQNGIRAGQKIPIHKWMNATGGGNKVSIGMTGECEIQMNWEKSNKVAKEHSRLYIDQERKLPMIKALATGVIYNSRAELAVGKSYVLSNGDTFKIGDTIFKYVESE